LFIDAPKRRPKRLRAPGFTLAETAIASAIALGVAILLGMLLLSYGRLTQAAGIRQEIERNARDALRHLESSAKSAARLSVENNGTRLALEFADGRAEIWEIAGEKLTWSPGGDAPAAMVAFRLAPTSAFGLRQPAKPGLPPLLEISLHFAEDRSDDSFQALTLDARVAARSAAAAITADNARK
jgi:hypothetical protein